MSRKALGRGLESLIPQEVKDTISADKLVRLPVSEIGSNPHQPRKQFDEEKIKTLSESIQSDGLLQPVVVRKVGDRYELIMGERRLHAARLAGVPTVPAIVRSAEEVDSLRLALVENLQRENLNPIEIAEAYRALIDKFGMSQNELSKLVGKDRSSVANALRLLSLPNAVRHFLVDGRISEGHARALLALSTAAAQVSLAERIVRDRLTVRQVEGEAGPDRKKRTAKRRVKEKPTHIAYLEKAMSGHLSTRVTVDEKRGGKGRIVIEFYSHDDFERLAELMHIPLPR
ncbi:MAG: ParB/RepB/Spo0J family partition protein [Candidatus Krumholzibacteria bacterium]|nr:ParB/RepB/Spo0J family partition protein [Candidatus Krumholzibacteria bacterium]